MAFEKAFENKYHELPQQTQYRFAEIEISKGINALTKFFIFEPNARQKASNTIYNAIVPNIQKLPEFEDRFYNMLSSTYFNQPNKNEIIHYLILKGNSYVKIRNLTNASFNTISKMRYGMPTYYPIFALWNEDMLNNWNSIKGNLNLFSEDLVHIKD